MQKWYEPKKLVVPAAVCCDLCGNHTTEITGSFQFRDRLVLGTTAMQQPSALARPEKVQYQNSKPFVTFHLREVCSVPLERYDESLWVFGNTANKNSVAIRVEGFKPYFFLECPVDLGDVDTWVGLMNEDMRPWERGPDIITRADIVQKVPMIGFTDNAMRKYLKIEYANQSYIWRLRKHFAASVHVGKTPRRLQMFHDDWSIESLFLHESNLKIQSWVTVECKDVQKKRTSCAIEKRATLTGFQSAGDSCEVSPIPPILCCVVRMRAHSGMSTEINPLLPCAEVESDRVTALAIQIYWMGEEQNVWSFVFDDDNETKLLSEFEHVIHGRFDVDCFVFLSDNCEPLQYITARKPALNLSKFSAFRTKVLRRKSDQTVYGVHHPGRSRLNVQCALKKMMLEPKLDGFCLKDAIFHPNLVRGNPSEALRGYSYLRAPFASKPTRKAQCEEEVDWMRRVEQNNSLLLGFVEVASASYTQLTVAISSGQQIRVWKKLLSKFHQEGLIINKEQLQKAPVVLKIAKVNSGFADPPELPNAPFCPERKGKNNDTGGNKRYRNLSGHIVTLDKRAKKAATKKRFQGGYVCDPEPGFFSGSSEATFTFDFGSLYPSIMQGYNVCYMRLVYDPVYLQDPTLVKCYVPINEHECIVMIDGRKNPAQPGGLEPARTVLPQTIGEVVLERQRVRELMKQTKDPFLYSSLNAKQLSCKVFQNAVYGFLGVEEHGLLACPVLMAMICCIGRNMIKRVKHMMIKDHGGYCVYGDTDSVMVQFPHPSHLTTPDAIFGYYYDLCRKLAVKGTALFPKPNVLEFETMKFPLWLPDKKKNYAAMEYPDSTWQTVPKLTIKGLPFIKRDRCPMVRRVGHKVMEFVLAFQHDKVVPYLKDVMQQLVRGRVAYEELSVSCLLQDESQYKSDNLIQLETARKISARTGSRLEPGTRLQYVILAGPELLYQRGEDPVYASKHRLSLDLTYYLDKQLLSAIEPLLQFHPELDLGSVVEKIRQEVKRKSTGVVSLQTLMRKRKRATTDAGTSKSASAV